MANRLKKYFLHYLIAIPFIIFFCGNLYSWTESDYSKYNYKTFANSPEANKRIDMNSIDYSLIHAAVFYETNRQRDLHGKVLFKHSSALEKAAWGHSMDMTKYSFFSHSSRVRGKETMSKRLTLVGITTGYRGENIATTFGIEYKAGRGVYSPVQNGGYFSYTYKGTPIKNHTYLGMGKAVVDQWMHSPGHRANILKSNFKYLGAGASYYPKRSFYNMPYFNFTQNFGSDVAGK